MGAKSAFEGVARNATGSAIPLSDQPPRPPQFGKPRPRLRNEYASSRVFVAGSWMSLVARLIPAANCVRERGQP
jgi:hypothetical protein